MNTGEPLNLEFNANRQQPVRGFVALMLAQAIHEKADTVTFELNQQLYQGCETESVQIGDLLSPLGKNPSVDDIAAAFRKLPKPFSITFKSGENTCEQPPAAGNLFTPVVRIILNAAEIPYWSKGRISGEFETVKPASKWKIESEDLTRSLLLKRIVVR